MSTVLKSKEDVLANREFDVHYYGGGRKDILKAMDEWAKQQSVGFANWTNEQQWICDPFLREGNEEIMWEKFESNPEELKTTPELYNLYLLSQSKK